MAFRLNLERKETINKTVRFPLPTLQKIEKALEGTELNFSQFVIQACNYALENMITEKEQKKKKTHS